MCQYVPICDCMQIYSFDYSVLCHNEAVVFTESSILARQSVSVGREKEGKSKGGGKRGGEREKEGKRKGGKRGGGGGEREEVQREGGGKRGGEVSSD
jgi:uncharacterized membrane protein YgcG